MKKTKWPEMSSHVLEDSMGRIFTFFHRDMGDGFTHEGHADCLCGPIRFSDDDMSTPAAMCTKLDQAERAMVN